VIEILHIVRRRGDDFALAQAGAGGPRHALLLVGDGVCNAPPDLRCFYSAADSAARGVAPAAGEPLADGAMLDLIFSCRMVISW
jgi:hypothetical protein